MMTNEIYLHKQFLVSTASPLDAITVFLNQLFGSNQTPDGYLMYLLVMCGLLIIGLVLIYNWWEERKFNEQVEKSFAPIKNDALLDQNKKQFLDKFAATTGYLSDTPDANSFGGQKPAEMVDEKSIDDVYSELLDTMSKRTQQKTYAEPTAATAQVDSADAFHLPNMTIDPEDAPLTQSSLKNLGTQENATPTAAEDDPEQHNAIRSIIDQVFRNKGQIKPTYPTASEPSSSIKSEVQKKTQSDESALNAYLSVKNTIAHDIAASQMQTTANQQAIEPPTLTEEALDDAEDGTAPSVLSSMIGLKVVNNQTEPASANQEADTPPAKAEPLPPALNSQTDLIGVVELTTGLKLERLADSFSSLYKEFDKPVFVYVLDANQHWLLLNSQNLSNSVVDSPLQKVVCSLQLADRSGAVSRNVINRFQMAFESIAINLGGRVQWHSEGDVFSQAMALDAFCIEVDKTMFFHLMHESTGPFTGIKLKGIAESQGMVLGNDGTFKFFGESSAKYPEFVMFNRDNHPFNPEMLRNSVVKAVTFQLDIPHTLPQAVALDHMVAVAKTMEVSLNAVLVDDNNRPLADIQIERIRDQIKSIHAMMQLRGIAPGSDIAHRLFS